MLKWILFIIALANTILSLKSFKTAYDGKKTIEKIRKEIKENNVTYIEV